MTDDQLSFIYSRKAAALAAVAEGERVHVDAARIVLALAIQEVLDACTGDTIRAALKAEIANLQEDLDAARAAHAGVCEERDSLQVQLLQCDADNASLTQEVQRLRSWTVDADARAAAAQPPPVAVLVQAFDADRPSTDYTGLDWSSLSQVAQDYRIGLDNSRWKWRDIPRTVRLELVRCVIRNAGDAPTQSQFDAIRPSWMASATSQVSAFNVLWGVLTNLDREIEVQP